MNVELYAPIVDFLALYLGSNSEIILCDTEKFLMIKNPSTEIYHPGMPLDKTFQTLISHAKSSNLPYHINYRSFSATGEKRRSATLFLGSAKKLEGLLTINTNIQPLTAAQLYLEQLINGEPPYSINKETTQNTPFDTLSLSVAEIISNVLDDAVIRFNSPLDRLNAQEKLSIIREMNERGVFVAKNSIHEVATKLGSSKASIYRYLQQLEKDSPKKSV